MVTSTLAPLWVSVTVPTLPDIPLRLLLVRFKVVAEAVGATTVATTSTTARRRSEVFRLIIRTTKLRDTQLETGNA
jgi:hypothetical protein